MEISDPRELEQKAKDEVSDEKLKQSTLIITPIEDCIKPLEEYFKAGYTRLYPYSTSPDEIKFIQDFCVRYCLTSMTETPQIDRDKNIFLLVAFFTANVLKDKAIIDIIQDSEFKT